MPDNLTKAAEETREALKEDIDKGDIKVDLYDIKYEEPTEEEKKIFKMLNEGRLDEVIMMFGNEGAEEKTSATSDTTK